MIEEINQKVSSIMDIIEKKKLEIINQNNEQISEYLSKLTDFANSIERKFQDPTIFSSIISYFFDVDNNRSYASNIEKIIEERGIEYTNLKNEQNSLRVELDSCRKNLDSLTNYNNALLKVINEKDNEIKYLKCYLEPINSNSTDFLGKKHSEWFMSQDNEAKIDVLVQKNFKDFKKIIHENIVKKIYLTNDLKYFFICN